MTQVFNAGSENTVGAQEGGPIDLTVINMVMVDCRSEVEPQYNKWYDEVHIPMCLRYDGMLRATRYRLTRGPSGHARYLTVYEFKDQHAMDEFPNSPECKASIQEMRQTWQDNDFQIKLAAQYENIGIFEEPLPPPGGKDE